MHKTYSERRQAILFVAAREYLKLAAAILDDCTEEAEFRGSSAAWCRRQAAKTARRGNELEQEGHEACSATPHADNANHRAHYAYEQAIARFEKRGLSFGVTPEMLVDKAEQLA